ncbi:hypothetical protein SK128_012358, partial [Halocaridina rubra]
SCLLKSTTSTVLRVIQALCPTGIPGTMSYGYSWHYVLRVFLALCPTGIPSTMSDGYSWHYHLHASAFPIGGMSACLSAKQPLRPK